MSGGIIIQRAADLLLLVTGPRYYGYLCPEVKAQVDAIDGKDPASRTEEDVVTLSCAITNAVTPR